MNCGIFLRFRLMMAALLAFAFIVLPGSAKADFHIHSSGEIAAAHSSHLHPAPADHGESGHENCVHAHGTCHVSFVAPEPANAFADVQVNSGFKVVRGSAKPQGVLFSIERPPRA